MEEWVGSSLAPEEVRLLEAGTGSGGSGWEESVSSGDGWGRFSSGSGGGSRGTGLKMSHLVYGPPTTSILWKYVM